MVSNSYCVDISNLSENQWEYLASLLNQLNNILYPTTKYIDFLETDNHVYVFKYEEFRASELSGELVEIDELFNRLQDSILLGKTGR